MSSIIWGIIMSAIGLFFTISGWKESQFPIYRLLVARSEILWGDNTHRFYQIVGIIIIIVGILMVLGLI